MSQRRFALKHYQGLAQKWRICKEPREEGEGERLVEERDEQAAV